MVFKIMFSCVRQKGSEMRHHWKASKPRYRSLDLLRLIDTEIIFEIAVLSHCDFAIVFTSASNFKELNVAQLSAFKVLGEPHIYRERAFVMVGVLSRSGCRISLRECSSRLTTEPTRVTLSWGGMRCGR